MLHFLLFGWADALRRERYSRASKLISSTRENPTIWRKKFRTSYTTLIGSRRRHLKVALARALAGIQIMWEHTNLIYVVDLGKVVIFEIYMCLIIQRGLFLYETLSARSFVIHWSLISWNESHWSKLRIWTLIVSSRAFGKFWWHVVSAAWIKKSSEWMSHPVEIEYVWGYVAVEKIINRLRKKHNL